MGTIADSIAIYAQPLLNSTDGSPEEVNHALAISQACWNLALLPEEQRDEALAKVQSTLSLGDDEFMTFRRDVLDPMIRRHHEMFPRLHQRIGKQVASHETSPTPPRKKLPGAARNAACPCNSGLKYKRCCGRS